VTKFFGRTAQVVLERATPFLPLRIGAPDESLHLQFTATKSTLGQPDTLDLSIYNLSENSRSALQGAGSYVFLRAGYESDKASLPTVFQGDIRTVDHIRRGGDWVTRIQCGDGELPYRFGQASKSFKAGTPMVDVAAYLAGRIKEVDPEHVSITRFINDLPSLLPIVQQFTWGFSTQGNAFDELQSILGGSFQLVIQDGELRVINPTEQRRIIPLVDADHGLIGSPEHGSPNANGLASVFKVTSLLRADLKPGDLISVGTRAQKNGVTYRIQKLVHCGDLAGDDWKTEMECLPFGFTT
jgi:hypothetical protein